MYCDKLISTVQQPNSEKYEIDKTTIQKLDEFIKYKTTIKERGRLNPYRFSIEMKVLQETSFMLFINASKCRLFEPRFYYNCYCEEQIELNDIENEAECTCGKKVIPQNEKDNVYIYFRLIEKPAECDWSNKVFTETDNYPLDFILKEGFEKENFTLADLESMGEEEAIHNLISKKDKREKMYHRYLEKADGYASS